MQTDCVLNLGYSYIFNIFFMQITGLQNSLSKGIIKTLTNILTNNEINNKIKNITNNINGLEENNNKCNLVIEEYEQILRNRKIFIDLIIENTNNKLDTNNENKLDQLTDQSTVLYMVCELLNMYRES